MLFDIGMDMNGQNSIIPATAGAIVVFIRLSQAGMALARFPW
jgi:hypothetical protein